MKPLWSVSTCRNVASTSPLMPLMIRLETRSIMPFCAISSCSTPPRNVAGRRKAFTSLATAMLLDDPITDRRRAVPPPMPKLDVRTASPDPDAGAGEYSAAPFDAAPAALVGELGALDGGPGVTRL